MSLDGRADELEPARSGGGAGLVLPANRPDVWWLAAAKVGGFWPTSNLPTPTSLLEKSEDPEPMLIEKRPGRHGARPRLFCFSQALHLPEYSLPAADQPRNRCFTGPIEPTNAWYAIAKNRRA